MHIKIVDTIEDFNIEEFCELGAIVSERLWVDREYLPEAKEEFETDEEGNLTPATFMEYFNKYYNPIIASVYVKSGDKVIGGCLIQDWSFDRVKISDLAVTLEQEGRGVGSMLVKEVINYCKSKNKVEIGLEVREGMPAYNLYLKNGFEPLNLIEDDLLESDEYCKLDERGIEVPSHNSWYMELAL